MTWFRLVVASLLFHRRMNLAVACGVAAATAVLTGALLVGDSVRGSLRSLALDRLGRIDELLVADRFFRAKMAVDLATTEKFRAEWSAATPAFIFPTALAETAGTGERKRAAGVLVLGGTTGLWNFSDEAVRPPKLPADDEVVLNEPLAKELGVKVGDAVTLRFSKLAQVPADSPLGRKTGRVQSLPNLRVSAVIPARSLGQFSLHPNQSTARCAFVSLTAMQEALEQPERANAVLVAGRDPLTPPDAEAERRLQTLLKPRVEDFGLTIKHVQRIFGEENDAETILDYYSLSSDRMLLEPAMEQAVLQAWQSHQPHSVLTYLANQFQKVSPDSPADAGDKTGIPYSTIAAVDSFTGGPLVDEDGKPLPALKEDEIALTRWAAEDLSATVGDRIRVRYFEPESTHGNEKEVSAEFRLAAIVPLTEPTAAFNRRRAAVFTDRPTAANDPDLTPEVPGITDQESISNWDAPFPFDQTRIRPKDDTYWENHRTTPKAYISLAAGRRLWSSRFGRSTSIRVAAAEGISAESLAAELQREFDRSERPLGLEFTGVKRQALAAASGTTPFDVLFLALSMFIIAAALMLVWLLFRLNVEQRVGEQGLLRAIGWSTEQAARSLLMEGAIVAGLGSVAGVGLGVGYAWLMLAGLRSWWIGAVATPFLTLHISAQSLLLGLILGGLMSLGAIRLSSRRLKFVTVRQLLSGRIDDADQRATSGGSRSLWIAAALAVVGIALVVVAAGLQGEAQGGAGLGAGAALLAALILGVRMLIAGRFGGDNGIVGSLSALATRNAGRNPTRSMATMSLMAAATFLIVSVSAFRLSPTEQGVGGFAYVAESSEPIVHDFNTAKGREELLGDDAVKLGDARVFSFRVQPGDDASCRNLYRPSQPRVLGVTPSFVNHFEQAAVAFHWAASAAKTPEETKNPWRLLAEHSAAEGAPVPVVLDKNTAMYSLRLYRGVGEEFQVTYADGGKITFRVAGLLAESVLQGSLLIGEADFERLFPRQSGYRYFLIAAPAEQAAAVAGVLEDRLGDEGFDVIDAKTHLTDLLAVQNTYISTFQTLGGLGLLLGTFGLAAVQMRNVLERRGELALLRAVGFNDGRLASLVMGENIVLLAGGLLTGVLAAAFALSPQLLSGAAQPPWRELSVTLAIVAVVGSLVSLIAVRAVLKAPVVAALRGE